MQIDKTELLKKTAEFANTYFLNLQTKTKVRAEVTAQIAVHVEEDDDNNLLRDVVGTIMALAAKEAESHFLYEEVQKLLKRYEYEHCTEQTESSSPRPTIDVQ